MVHTDVIGYVAAVCTTTSFMPQVIQTWKTRSAKDLNMKMYLVLCAGLFLWLLYGVFTSSLPIIIANALSLFLALVILFLKLKYG